MNVSMIVQPVALAVVVPDTFFFQYLARTVGIERDANPAVYGRLHLRQRATQRVAYCVYDATV